MTIKNNGEDISANVNNGPGNSFISKIQVENKPVEKLPNIKKQTRRYVYYLNNSRRLYFSEKKNSPLIFNLIEVKK